MIVNSPFTAVVIGVGNELLNGGTANTNAQWLCGEIYSLGGSVMRVLTVPDDLREIEAALRETLLRGPRWVIMTGGLGPTYDDMTLTGVAAALGRGLSEDEAAREMILKRLREYKVEGRTQSLDLTPERAKMARIPTGSKPLSNSAGTAPGVLIESDGGYIACLPGVPSEMKAIFQEHLAPMMAKDRLKTITVDTEIRGIPEAALAPTLAIIAKKYPRIYVKSHPRGSEGVSRVLVQLTGRGDEGIDEVESARKELAAVLDRLDAAYEMRTRQDNH